MDNRQRRADHGLIRGGDHRTHRQKSRRTLPRTDRRIRHFYYTRIDAPATPEQKAKLEKLTPDAVKESDLAGEPITAKLTKAPGNNAPIGGLKVVAESGWFAARPSGTENIYKIYAESFKSQAHLNAILREAEAIVNNALGSPAVAPKQGART